MIADTVRMIRHCQSDQPGEYFHICMNSFFDPVIAEFVLPPAAESSVLQLYRSVLLLQFLSNRFQTDLYTSLYDDNTDCVCDDVPECEFAQKLLCC